MAVETSKEEFFNFYEQRIANLEQIETLQPTVKAHGYASFNPELNILLAAELDSLSKYWAISVGKKYPSSGQQLGEFLEKSANAPIWMRCSHVNLLGRASGEIAPKNKLTQNQYKVLCHELDSLLAPIVKIPYAVFDWRQDPDLSILVSNAEIQGAGISSKWLRLSRYGEILYRHHRCGWLHALNPDPELLTEIQDRTQKEPHYRTLNEKVGLIIPTEFILQTLKDAVSSFASSVPDGSKVTLGD